MGKRTPHEPVENGKKPRLDDVEPADSFEKEVEPEDKAGSGGNASQRHEVRHEVELPPSYNYTPLAEHTMSKDPARTYSFELDPFQKLSVACIEREESVLVSAHTSAGKTVVAEYAIAQCLKRGQRVVYTSPIKALSNQKYREMLAEFEDVGLMTGDVTINPSASCLVMTTEILRSMLYRGSEIMREVAWVVFDEIHYMRDKERGVVWEETIILLPDKVRYVFLSATIPNAREFAAWICHIHKQPCHVVYTNYRPTPLQHYMFPAGGNGIYLVMDETGTFREENFQKAMGALAQSQGEDPRNAANGGKQKKGVTPKGELSDIGKIVKMIMVRNYNPVIVFAFSKRECENLALQMSKVDFNTQEEAEMVDEVFSSAVASLSEDDRKLPQIEDLPSLLKRGIGIHHGGLLPVLKEVIEILFQEGLIKVLFATETFSIGLNMPAKTVVFTNVRKYDGVKFRDLTSGEYIQMSGRAGRRGLDDRGIVIMMCDEKLEPSAAKNMIKGDPDRLNSAFHLGYNMVLNLMRVEELTPEYILQNSFFQFQHAASLPRIKAKVEELENEYNSIAIQNESTIADYYSSLEQLKSLRNDYRAVVNHPTNALPFLQPGRLVHVRSGSVDLGWGLVVETYKRTASKKMPSSVLSKLPPPETYIADVLLTVAHTPAIKNGRISPLSALFGADPTLDAADDAWIKPSLPGNESTLRYIVVPVLFSTLDGISELRVPMKHDVKKDDGRNALFRMVKEILNRFPSGPALLDPKKSMKISDDTFTSLCDRIHAMESVTSANPLHTSGTLDPNYRKFVHKQLVHKEIASLKASIEDINNITHLEELKCRKHVLHRLGFASQDDVVEQKGRVACEVSTGDELLLTELIFNGVFSSFTPAQCAALLSCFVFDEKSENTPRLKQELSEPLQIMQAAARRIAHVAIDAKLPIVEEDYVASFKPELMDAVFSWCNGASFKTICDKADVFEGSIVRVFRRLDELIHQAASAARVIGSLELEEKFNQAAVLLERPSSVAFASSLYI